MRGQGERVGRLSEAVWEAMEVHVDEEVAIIQDVLEKYVPAEKVNAARQELADRFSAKAKGEP